MECYNPILIKLEKASATSGNRQFVPCGSCYACLSSKRNEWSIRLKEQAKKSENAKFHTLTYSEENVPSDGVSLRHVQLFLKKYRKQQARKGVLKYFAVGEYGDKTSRPHYHVIMFNDHSKQDIKKVWEKGYVKTDPCQDGNIHYITKYMLKTEETPPGQKPEFRAMSKGLGKDYIKTNGKYHKAKGSTTYVDKGGVKTNLPRYYREKIFNKYQRKQLGEQNREKAENVKWNKSASFIQSEQQAKIRNANINSKKGKL